jgi:hypothetical protein
MTVSCTSEGRERRYWLSLEIRAGTSDGENILRALLVE